MAENSTSGQFHAWLMVTALWIGLGIFVPYGVLAQSPLAPWTPVFWAGFGLGVIGLILWPVMRWQGLPDRGGDRS